MSVKGDAKSHIHGRMNGEGFTINQILSGNDRSNHLHAKQHIFLENKQHVNVNQNGSMSMMRYEYISPQETNAVSEKPFIDKDGDTAFLCKAEVSDEEDSSQQPEKKMRLDGTMISNSTTSATFGHSAVPPCHGPWQYSARKTLNYNAHTFKSKTSEVSDTVRIIHPVTGNTSFYEVADNPSSFGRPIPNAKGERILQRLRHIKNTPSAFKSPQGNPYNHEGFKQSKPTKHQHSEVASRKSLLSNRCNEKLTDEERAFMEEIKRGSQVTEDDQDIIDHYNKTICQQELQDYGTGATDKSISLMLQELQDRLRFDPNDNDNSHATTYELSQARLSPTQMLQASSGDEIGEVLAPLSNSLESFVTVPFGSQLIKLKEADYNAAINHNLPVTITGINGSIQTIYLDNTVTVCVPPAEESSNEEQTPKKTGAAAGSSPGGGKQKHKCTMCNRSFPKPSKLKQHMMIHRNNRPFPCLEPGCDWSFITKNKLKRHIESHTRKNLVPCTHPGCEKTFTTIYNLQTHQKIHSKPLTEVCPIEGCVEAFSNKTQLDGHLRLHGPGAKTFQCPHPGCPKMFYSGNSMGSHKRMHERFPIICDVEGCGKEFDKPSRLNAHKRVHTGEKPYKCTGCEKKFPTASKLNRHISTHTGERKYKCPMEGCEKSFQRKEHLKGHMTVHSKEKPFACNITGCNSQFSARSSLYVHQNKQHESGACDCPYVGCQRKFKNQHLLEQHIYRMHSTNTAEGGGELRMCSSAEETAAGFLNNLSSSCSSSSMDRTLPSAASAAAGSTSEAELQESLASIIMTESLDAQAGMATASATAAGAAASCSTFTVQSNNVMKQSAAPAQSDDILYINHDNGSYTYVKVSTLIAASSAQSAPTAMLDEGTLSHEGVVSILNAPARAAQPTPQPQTLPTTHSVARRSLLTPMKPQNAASTSNSRTVKQQVVKQPAMKQPAVKQQAVKQPAMKQPAVKQQAVKPPAMKQPAGRKAVVKSTTCARTDFTTNQELMLKFKPRRLNAAKRREEEARQAAINQLNDEEDRTEETEEQQQEEAAQEAAQEAAAGAQAHDESFSGLQLPGMQGEVEGDGDFMLEGPIDDFTQLLEDDPCDGLGEASISSLLSSPPHPHHQHPVPQYHFIPTAASSSSILAAAGGSSEVVLKHLSDMVHHHHLLNSDEEDIDDLIARSTINLQDLQD